LRYRASWGVRELMAEGVIRKTETPAGQRVLTGQAFSEEDH
jgi:hypothetical protein